METSTQFIWPDTRGPGARRYRVRGFTIVELMVSLTLALLILGGLVTLFSNTSVARGEIDKSSRQIENGRFAVQTMSDEIRHAGYFGALANAPAVPANLPDPCSTAVSVGTPDVGIGQGIGLPVQGYAGNTALGMAATLSCLNAASGYVPNTAVLVVRRVSTAAAMTPAAVASAAAASFYVQTSGCAGDANPYILADGSGTFSLHAKDSTTPCLPLASAPAGPISPLLVRIYFVSSCSNKTDCTAAGANSAPTLKRIDITPGATTVTGIADGIENIQFEYGQDTDADGAPNSYSTTTTLPSTPADWANVVSVRVHVLARNLDPTGGFTDSKTYALGAGTSVTPGGSFKRHAYDEVVRINNVAGRRE